MKIEMELAMEVPSEWDEMEWNENVSLCSIFSIPIGRALAPPVRVRVRAHKQEDQHASCDMREFEQIILNLSIRFPAFRLV